jgi:hypothetical protein
MAYQVWVYPPRKESSPFWGKPLVFEVETQEEGDAFVKEFKEGLAEHPDAWEVEVGS